jgi:acyl carrier protein
VPPTVAGRAAEIKSVVCRVLEVGADEVAPTTLFVEDLGADSMKLLELLANLEIEFDVEVDESEFERLINLDGVYEVLGTALDG